MARRTSAAGPAGPARQGGFLERSDRRQQTMNSTPERTTAQKTGRLYAMVGLLVLLLAFVAVTFYLLTRESRNEQEWIRLSTDLQVHSQQLAKSAAEAVEGNRSAFLQLGDSTGTISDAVGALKDGDRIRSLPALPASMSETLTDLDQTWRRMETNARNILDREDQVMTLATESNAFIQVIPQIQELTDRAIRELTSAGASRQQLFVAGRQLVLSDRVLRHLKEMLRGGSGSVAAADNFTKEIQYFEQTMDALLRGSRSVGIEQVSQPAAREALDEARQLYDAARPQLDTILNSTADILAVRGAADAIFVDSLDMFDLARSVSGEVLFRSDTRLWPSLWSGSLALVVIVVAIALMVRSFLASERRRAVEARMQNQKNQQAIMRLLDEMSSLADGDLTVRATVTEDMTGAIADAVNFAVEQLRELVTGINITAHTVSESAQETMDTTRKLAAAAGEQAEQVGETASTMNVMAESFDGMAKRSLESSEVARKSVEIAHNGSQMVQQTIRGMDTIRDQIQDTSKRIKRLGESSQEIGDIVELINGIAEQTNILALNPAIQSASASSPTRSSASPSAPRMRRAASRCWCRTSRPTPPRRSCRWNRPPPRWCPAPRRRKTRARLSSASSRCPKTCPR